MTIVKVVMFVIIQRFGLRRRVLLILTFWHCLSCTAGLTISKKPKLSRRIDTALSDEVDSRIRQDQSQMELIKILQSDLQREKTKNDILEERLNNFIDEEQVSGQPKFGSYPKLDLMLTFFRFMNINSKRSWNIMFKNWSMPGAKQIRLV